MDCDFCDEKATVFLTQFVDDEMKKVCLCEDCAAERGVTDPIGLSLGDPSLGAFENQPVESLGAGSRSCPTCGFTLGHLQKVGRLGCADCYRAFSAEISQMIMGMHKGFKHDGKVPEGLAAKHAFNRELEDLKNQLQVAIDSEDFETAAVVRDQITRLESLPV